MKSGAFSEISQRRHRRKGPVAAVLYFYHGLLGRCKYAERSVEKGPVSEIALVIHALRFELRFHQALQHEGLALVVYFVYAGYS